MEINRVPLPSPLPSRTSSPFLPFPRKFFFASGPKIHLLYPSTPNSTPLFFHCGSSSSITPRNWVRNRSRRTKQLVINMSAEEVNSGDMIHQSILEQGIFRFDCSSEDRNSAFPSLSFADSKLRETPINSNGVPSFVPTFEKASDQQIVTLTLPAGTNFYGTGEASGPLERTGKRIFTWNSDAWGYGPGTTSLYQSHPWVLALLPSGEALGVLADTTKRCEIDLRSESTIKFAAASSYPVITFGPFASSNDVLVSLSHAIGTVFMPPKWALGYQQCRWSYMSDKRVLEVAKTFRDKDIPCDVIWMDIDYMNGFRCFTFDSERFPDPKSLVKDLHSIGIKAIWMLDPGIKLEKGYFVYDSGSEAGVWIQSADGKPFIGEVWPGLCAFPDFTQSKVRSWWANLVKDFVSNGVDGIWNDMNEPAVFKVVTKTMPDNNVHLGDPEFGGRQNHSHYHNVYGMLMARSTYEGMKLAHENKRPFVLTRAGFIGSQRYAATWTGDNISTWEHLHMSISMVLQLSLSGQPLSGPDIGGFAGNATPRLFARWMGIGALFPFSRGHSEMDTIDHEPWSFGAECEEVCRLALKRRYRLLPHIYTLFYLAHVTGSPVASPTFFTDPTNSGLRKAEDSFMLGPLLIHTSTKADEGIHQIQPQLPKGLWLNFDFDDSHPDLPSLFLRGGSITPLGPLYQHSGEAKSTDDVTLLVALDEQGKAKGVLFEDDGDGYEFTKGGYLLTHYEAELQSSVVTVKISKTDGLWKRPKRRLHIQLLLGGYAMIDAWGTDGEDLQFKMPPDNEVSKLVSVSKEKHRTQLGSAKLIPDAEDAPGKMGTELSKTPVELKSGDWCLKVVPWIGGRIISMEHVPTGTQWLHSRVEINGYEEYSGTDYRSAGCTEEYTVIRTMSQDIAQAGEEESLKLAGDIGGGLFLERQISVPKDKRNVVSIESAIVARKVGAGSGGYSRLVCLRVHPTFNLLNPSETFVSYSSMDGSKHEIRPDSGELSLEGDARPNGEWMLVDKCLGVSLINRFDIKQVHKCLIHWGTGNVNLELWSEQRPVSSESPLEISHEYEATSF